MTSVEDRRRGAQEEDDPPADSLDPLGPGIPHFRGLAFNAFLLSSLLPSLYLGYKVAPRYISSVLYV